MLEYDAKPHDVIHLSELLVFSLNGRSSVRMTGR